MGIYLDENVILEKEFMDYFINLSLKLESVIKKYSIDAVVLNNAPLSLVFKITQGKVLFIRDENLWIEFVTKTWSLYHDHAITSRNLLKDRITA